MMTASEVLLWIHEDNLNPNSTLFQLYPTAPRIFVFDEAQLASLSFKRIVFQYECLLEIPALEIRKGPLVPELLLAAQAQNCQHIVTTPSVSPAFAQACTTLQREPHIRLEILPVESFVSLSEPEAAQLDLKRFSRYWQRVKSRLLSLNQSFDW